MKLETIQTQAKLNEIHTIGEPGPGGGYHEYRIVKSENPKQSVGLFWFQNGHRNDPKSTPGVIDSDLLGVVRHRLQCFQAGESACEYNQEALEHIEKALEAMNRRVEDRIKRNVLATYQK